MVTQPDVPIVVIGAGVSGLTTGLRLAEAGFAVTIRAESEPPETTSAAAGAMWGPHLVADPRLERWAKSSLAEFEDLVGEERGIRLVTGIEASPVEVAPPGWMTQSPGFRDCAPDELPHGYVVGWEYVVPMIDMPVYLGYLAARVKREGVRFEYGPPITADELPNLAPLVVNCAGMGAAKLVGDDSLVGIRGDLIAVENPGITRFFAEHTDEVRDQTYILPHGSTHVLLGTSARAGDVSRMPDPEIAEGIIGRCAKIEPLLRGARMIEHRVGTRPNRPSIRLESEQLEGCTLIHNYGHGGGGVSLSWGCADEVCVLAEKAKIDYLAGAR